MKNINYYLKFAIIIFAVCFFNIQNQGYSQDKASEIDELLSLYNEYEIFNGAALVAENGEVIFKKGYGLANMDWNITNEPDTKFRIGSITKQFVAMLIMQLVEEGKIDLNGKLTDYLPEYREDTGDKITIHHLLTHTSGITSYTNLPGVWQDSLKNHYTQEEMIKLLHSSDLEFEPGTEFNYNNTGYYLLGAIVERIYDKPVGEVLQEKIFEPLGMTNTGVDRENIILEKRATGYVPGAYVYEINPYIYMPNVMGAGDMYSTVEDLYKWDRALYTEKLLSDKFKTTKFTPFLNDYAYGWSVFKVQGKDTDSTTITSHTGGINGFTTIIFRMVDENNLIVLFNNTGSTQLRKMTEGIVSILHNLPYDKPKRSFANILRENINNNGIDFAIEKYNMSKESIRDEYDVEELEINVLGYFYLGKDKIREAIEVFKINIEEFPESFNVYDSMGEAYMENGDIDLAIQYYKKSLEINPQNTNGIEMLKRLGVDVETPEEIKLTNDVLERYAGKYKFSPDFYITITVEGDQIFEQATGQKKFEIFPTSETEFFLKVVDAKIKFDKSEDGNVTGFTLFQNLMSMPFEKVE